MKSKRIILIILGVLVGVIAIFTPPRRCFWGTPETLWVGDSLAALCPTRGIKAAHFGAETRTLIHQVHITEWPEVKYDRIIIMGGTADHFGRKIPIEDVRNELQVLADKLFDLHGVKPIIIDPLVIAEIASQEGMSPDSDGNDRHLSVEGYTKLFSLMEIANP